MCRPLHRRSEQGSLTRFGLYGANLRVDLFLLFLRSVKACLAQVGQRVGVFARGGLFVGLLPVFVALFLTLLRLFRFLVFTLFLCLAVGTGRFELLLVLLQVRQKTLCFDCGLGQCGNETRIQLLGFERERHNQAAGFRTYIIVSDASALVMMTNIFVAGIGETDLVRMSASVITGLGFLGAGTILVTRNQEVRGLTTAAGLWAVAIIGTAFGAGFYAGGIICYAFIFLAMQVLRRVDLRIRKTQRVSTVYFEMEKKSTVGQIIRQVKGHGHYIWDLNLFSETQEKSGGPVCGTFTLWVNGKTTLDEEIQALEALDGVSYMTLM